MKDAERHLNVIRELDPFARFVYYINERWSIRQARREGLPQEQWTKDAIFRKYKFTNARRSWDYTSQWLITNWYKPYGHTEHAGIAASFARFFCYVPTFQLVGFPKGFQGNDWLNRAQNKLTVRAETGSKVFTSAYMIGGVAKGEKKVFWVIDKYLRPVHRSGLLRDVWRGTIDELHNALHEYNGWGDFLTQEVVLDLMYTFVLSGKKQMNKRLYGYAGPGAIRGLNRVHGRQYDAGMNRIAAQEEMVALWQKLCNERALTAPLRKVLTVHDVEFNLCEFDKYNRVLFGQGVPKQLFTPRTTGEPVLL